MKPLPGAEAAHCGIVASEKKYPLDPESMMLWLKVQPP